MASLTDGTDGVRHSPLAGRGGLVLHPFRAVRPAAGPERLGRLLCPPYDVIGPEERAALLAADADNAVALVLPEGAADEPDPYRNAARTLTEALAQGRYVRDGEAALYVYEMATDGVTTRGLLGAVGLHPPEDGVILPHEDTMAGPVADRLALMSATQANLEPIYLVYSGGGPASEVVAGVDEAPALAQARTPDGVVHRLWALTDPEVHRAVATDLAGRHALIADGHHRYATYLQLQQLERARHGPGPWDRGLTLLVDTSSYGPQVHAIHRVLAGIPVDEVVRRADGRVSVSPVPDAGEGLRRAATMDDFVVVVSGSGRTVLIADDRGQLAAASREPGEPAELAALDVTVLHRGFVRDLLGLTDSVDQVGYAHSVTEAETAAERSGGTAVLLRPTPVAAVAAVAAQGARMPRKSTLFTPKPASGLVIRRFADEVAAAGS